MKRPSAAHCLWPSLAAVFAAGVVYAVANSAETAALLPFGQWGRVNEIGYRAVWNGFFRDVLPFVPFGFLLPWAFKRVNTLGKAALAGLGRRGADGRGGPRKTAL